MNLSDKERQDVCREFLMTFGQEGENVMRLNVIIRALRKHNILDDSFRDDLMELRIEQLQKRRDYLKNEAESKKSKPPFHEKIFLFFGNFIIRMVKNFCRFIGVNIV